MSRHVMTYEGKRRKGKVKTTKKVPPWKRKVKAVQRRVTNVLGGAGLIALAILIFQLIKGGL